MLSLTTGYEKLKHVQYLHFILLDLSHFIVIQFHIVLWFLTCMNINWNEKFTQWFKCMFFKYLEGKNLIGAVCPEKKQQQYFHRNGNYCHVIVFPDHVQWTK